MLVRRLLVSAAVGVATVLIAAPAFASTSVNWGPLASYYKNQERSFSYGSFYNDRSTYATVKAFLNDPSNDGNNAYTNADEYFYEATSTCGTDSNGNPLTCWAFDRTKQGPEYDYFNTPVTFYMYNSLHDTASYARASIYTCAQMGWPVPDQCSPHAVTTFSY
jgi:hypothetical protein